jgi:hypothetical protein
MSTTPEQYASMLDEAGIDTESFTFLVVAGGTRESVGAAMGIDLTASPDTSELDLMEFSAYALTEVTGGVIAIEHSGYADPSPAVLALMSADGGAAAVARSNIQAHERFGCARDGELVFDDNEFMYVEAEDKEQVPQELRALFDSAWVDLDEEEDDDGGIDDPAGVLVALAMATLFTGVEVSATDLQRARESTYHVVKSLTYLD